MLTACPAGFYRTDADPVHKCKRCPKNTKMDAIAAPFCECLTGYFRNTVGLDDECPIGQSHEDAMTKCTSKLTAATYCMNCEAI